jgi:hypothetical protein
MTIIYILLIGLYLLSCIGFYRNALQELEGVKSLENVSEGAKKAGTFVCSAIWPVIVMGAFIVKGVVK